MQRRTGLEHLASTPTHLRVQDSAPYYSFLPGSLSSSSTCSSTLGVTSTGDAAGDVLTDAESAHTMFSSDRWPHAGELLCTNTYGQQALQSRHWVVFKLTGKNTTSHIQQHGCNTLLLGILSRMAMPTCCKLGLRSLNSCVTSLGNCFSCRNCSPAVAKAAMPILTIAPARRSCNDACACK